MSIALVILVVTAILSLIGLFAAPQIVERSLFRPYWFLRRRQYATLITSGLMHADLPHLIFNLMTFYFFAFQLERRVGAGAFGVLYLLSLVLSNIGSLVKHRNNPQYATLGASGAITAVLFASIVFYPEQSLFILPIPVPIPAPIFAIGYLAYTWYSSRRPPGSDRINHDSHLGGALFGLLFVLLVEPTTYAAFLRTVLG